MNQKASSPPDDAVQIRCPKLGHQVSFSYCRQEDISRPCSRSLDCWFRYFAVAEYLQQTLGEQEWQRTFARPAKPKVLSLVEMIEAAQQRIRKD